MIFAVLLKKISLKTGNLTSHLLNVIVEVSDYSRRVIAESLETYNKGGTTDMNMPLRRFVTKVHIDFSL